jgi:hypothetical protein
VTFIEGLSSEQRSQRYPVADEWPLRAQPTQYPDTPLSRAANAAGREFFSGPAADFWFCSRWPRWQRSFGFALPPKARCPNSTAMCIWPASPRQLSSAATVTACPHIDAATQDDLFIAQGYVTAQDRLWQMDASRRNANGELAEVMGPALIQHDKTQRVLQIRLTAQRFYAICRRRPPPLRRLRTRRQSLHRAVRTIKHSARRIPIAPLPPASLDRRGLHQRGSFDGADSRHPHCYQARARPRRRQTQQPGARGRSLPRRLLARSAAHRHQG